MCWTNQIQGIQWECSHRTRCGAVQCGGVRYVASFLTHTAWRRTATHPVWTNLKTWSVLAGYHAIRYEISSKKCCPILYYGVDCCYITGAQIKSIDFVLNGSFRKIFNTRSSDIVRECMSMFQFSSATACIARRKCNFIRRLMSSDNLACQLCHNYASADYLYWSHVMDDFI